MDPGGAAELRLLGGDQVPKSRQRIGTPETSSRRRRHVNLEKVDDDPDGPRRRSPLKTDGLRHRALRKLIQREFSQGPLARKYEEFLRGLTKVTVDKALQNTEFDFVEKVSADFPINVLVRLLDVPVSDTGMLINWGNQMIGNTDPTTPSI